MDSIKVLYLHLHGLCNFRSPIYPWWHIRSPCSPPFSPVLCEVLSLSHGRFISASSIITVPFFSLVTIAKQDLGYILIQHEHVNRIWLMYQLIIRLLKMHGPFFFFFFFKFSLWFHLKNHNSKDVNFKFQLKLSCRLDARSNYVYSSCLFLTV